MAGKKTTEEILEYLNHQVTKNTTDIEWVKKIQWWQVALLFTILAGVLGRYLA